MAARDPLALALGCVGVGGLVFGITWAQEAGVQGWLASGSWRLATASLRDHLRFGVVVVGGGLMLGLVVALGLRRLLAPMATRGRTWAALCDVLQVCLVLAAPLVMSLWAAPDGTVALIKASVPHSFKLLRGQLSAVPRLLVTGAAGLVLLGAAGAALRLVPLRRPPTWLMRAAGGLSLAVWVGLEVVQAGVERTMAPLGPNLLLITVDTLRADHLSAYGHPRSTSPHIDALAERGIVLSMSLAPAPWTLPSMASIHTGVLPSSHGAVSSHLGIPDRMDTLAERLRQAGYRTLGVVSHKFVDRKHGFHQGFEVFDQTWIVPHDARSSPGLVDVASGLLDSVRGPWFLWVHFFDPHYSYLQTDGYDWADGYTGSLPAHGVTYGDLVDRTDLVETDVDFVRDLYDEEIAYTDRWIGALLEAVPDLEQTLVVITADHGEGFREHGTFGHGGTVYDEVVHVPLLVGGAVPPAQRGTVVTTPVSSISATHTLLAAAGARLEHVGGVDLLALAAGQAQAPEFVFTEGSHAFDPLQQTIAVRRGNLKLIRDLQTGVEQLFDVGFDTRETRNRLGHSPLHALEASLRVALDNHLAGRPSATQGRAVNLSQTELEHLEALGYVDP